MKFHILKALILCFLIASVHLTERKYMRRFHRKNTMPAGLSIFANIAFGIIEGLAAGNAEWQKCLPPSWGVASTEGNADAVGDSIKSLGQIANQILGIIRSVLDLFCKYKNQIFSLLKGGSQGFGAISSFLGRRRMRFMARRRARYMARKWGCKLF